MRPVTQKSWSGRVPVPAAVSTESDEALELRRRRVTLYVFVCFLLWLVIGVVSQASALFWFTREINETLFPLVIAHVAVTAVLGVPWAVSRFVRLPPKLLTVVDVFATLVQGVATALILPHAIVGYRTDLSMIMGYSFIVIARAAIVPLKARASFVVALLGSVPLVISTRYTFAHATAPPLPANVAATQIAVWALLGAALAAVISNVIYGLRRTAREVARLGQYIIERKIGAGGMGTVFRARHVLLRRPTAVKVLYAEDAGDLSIARFEREVQLTSELAHPHIVSIYDYGRSSDGAFYYAMEYLEGFDLQRIVDADGPMPASRVVHILAQAADALADAHDAGLVHRDVKPSNLMLCPHRRRPDNVKVLDFGLVKRHGADPSLSTSNAIAGTPLYMSPEAITAPERVDARSDLYALGAVGYFLLTGEPVFGGTSTLDVLAKTLHGEVTPPSTRLGAPVPEKLERLLMACLAKERADRPADAATFRDALLACDDIPRWTPEDAQQWWSSSATEKMRAASSTVVDANGESAVGEFSATLTIAPREVAAVLSGRPARL